MLRFFKIFSFLMSMILSMQSANASIFSDDYKEPIKLLDRPIKNLDLEFPSGYRVLGEKFDYSKYRNKKLDLYGLDKLNISGSSQFTAQQLENIVLDVMQKYPHIRKFIVLDLRQESHGFIDGKPFRFYLPRNTINEKIDPETILDKEEAELKALSQEKNKEIHVRYSNKVDDGEKFSLNHYVSFQTNDIKAESEVVEMLYRKIGGDKNVDIVYERLYVQDHHKPSFRDVERFIEIMESTNETTWVHIHCAGGKGRTTTFMSLADMIENAGEISFEDIIKRQHLIGGSNLLDVSKDTKGEWRSLAAKERLEMLETFYNFVVQKDGITAGKPWSEFAEEQKKQ